ncbi:UNKNOWN [Stylonychia lemnae]|uniref:Uncharacterized protein n=1 Tax=Stylonychia lemnae TaxID=5949 RepID=A0A078ANT5_STYLE|nr:UNKNOWN [Stylonychia lemnae]|eukprot:CDW82628.1 UNKNOWN [Stylonychia lemnae]
MRFNLVGVGQKKCQRESECPEGKKCFRGICLLDKFDSIADVVPIRCEISDDCLSGQCIDGMCE